MFSRPAYLITALLAALATGVAALWRIWSTRRLRARISEREFDYLRSLDEARRRAADLEAELARARESAAAAESRFRSTFDQSAVGMNHVGLDGRILRVNRRYCAITGYEQEDLLRLKTADITHPDDLEAEQRNIEILRGGERSTTSWDKRYIRKDGAVIWVHATASLVRSASGDPLHLAGVIEDVTARVNAQEALRQSEQRFRQVVEHAPFGIFVETNLEFRYLNAAAAALFGADSPQQLVGTPLLDRVHPEDRAEARERARVAAGGADVPAARRRLLRLDGESFPAEVFPAPIVYDREPACLVLVRDCSREQRAEQERLRLEQRLHQVRKMESIGRLAGGVAHDFNNHLTVINGYCDMLLDELAHGDPLCEELGEIRAAATRAAALTQQLLAFSRRQPAEMRPLDLNTVVQEHCRILERLVGEDIEVIAEPAPDLAAVDADRDQLHQVLMNLAINARDAMPRGGKLIFQTANADIPATPERAAEDVPPGPYVVLTVSDTGVGMSPEVLARMFDPFFTTKPAGGGTGLGLSTVYGIVEHSGGFIRADSQPGVGTTFRVYLPRATAAPVAEPAAPPPAASTARPAVLVIDDDSAVRGYLRNLLANAGYEVRTASDGDAGLTEVERGQVSLVITDLVMPEREGLETMKALRTRFPDVRIIAVSGAFDGEFLKAASRLGADATFPKPIDPERLLPAVRTLIG